MAVLTPEQAAFRDRAREVASKIAPWAQRSDEAQEFPEDSYQAMIDGGLIGMTMPIEYGGQGLGTLEACIAMEEITRACSAAGAALQMNINGPAIVIRNIGTDEQRRKYLPGVVDGSNYFAVAMTEPGAGSSGTELTSSLTPVSGGYLLNGEKRYVTAPERANLFMVWCRIAGTQRADGIGAVIVPRDSAGLTIPAVDEKMGMRGVPEIRMRFSDVFVPVEAVVVKPEPGNRAGARRLISQFNPERCGNAAGATGLAQDAFDEAMNYAKNRRQFGREIIEFQGIQWKFADMLLQIETSRLLYMEAATAELDADGFPNTRKTLMAKLYSNEMVIRVVNEALQIHGHAGYLHGSRIERRYRDARGYGIAGGTNEIVRNMLAAEAAGRRFSQWPEGTE
jgi:alkylation response protein AidB-like acyl-CoA dehydrogenase